MIRKGSGLYMAPLLFLTFILNCNRQNVSNENNSLIDAAHSEEAVKQGVIQFDTLVHDFGTLIEGEQVVCYFDYKNSGDGDFVIQSVESSCGCTVPGWSDKPLPPSSRETIKVMFDTSGRIGEQAKVITVHSNAANSEVRLKISAIVKPS